jgi:hypothetical protein
MHAGQFRSPNVCATCHTSGSEDMGSTDANDKTPQTIDFRVMIHKLHNGAHLPSVQGVTTAADGSRVYGAGTPYVVGDTDFSGVLFPSFPNFSIAMPKDTGYSTLAAANKTKEDNIRKGATSCFNCHGDPDGAGPQKSPAQGDVAYTTPSRRACYACHDDVKVEYPYAANGTTMPANAPDAACNVCHSVAGAALAVKDAHVHPVLNPVISPTIKVNLTGVNGGTGQNGKFLVGDSPTVTFNVKDANNADVPITYFDSFSLALTGPTTNRQVVIPGTLTATPFDITGRLAAASTTNKGIMSKVYPTGAAVSETFLVDFSSPVAFSVTGTVSGPLGNGTLPGSPGTNPASSSITNVVLKPAAVAQNITLAFTGPTSYTVTGSVSGGMGSGNLPASVSNTQRFTSLDGTVSFNVVLGATAPAAGNSVYMTVFKGSAANPVLFAIVGGRTAFAAADRFYFDFIAPAPSYSIKTPMDLQFEFLGKGDGNAGQVLTAGNLPVYYGRQTLWERTALAGAQTTTVAANGVFARYVFVNAIDPGLAANDYIVIDEGTAVEEYARVSGIDANLRRIQTSWPLRYAHGANATVQEATLTYRQEGAANFYTLNPATGAITFNAPTTLGNAFVLSYRTEGHFGWKRKAGDSIQSVYFAPLQEVPGLDETWGDWRGKPLVDGTYTIGLWGYRSVELSSGGGTAPSGRPTVTPRTRRSPISSSARRRRRFCPTPRSRGHRELQWLPRLHHVPRRRSPRGRHLHDVPRHAGPHGELPDAAPRAPREDLPRVPERLGGVLEVPRRRERVRAGQPLAPDAQGKPSLDWSVPCTGCHSSPSAKAHADTQVSSTGNEACYTCHGPKKDLAAQQMHKAR